MKESLFEFSSPTIIFSFFSFFIYNGFNALCIIVCMIWVAYSCFFGWVSWVYYIAWGYILRTLVDIETEIQAGEIQKERRKEGEGEKTYPPASPVGRENPLPVEPSLVLIARTKEMVAPRRWVRRADEEVRMMVLRSIITVFLETGVFGSSSSVTISRWWG